MSDSLRQDTSDKAAAALKPDSEKTTLEKAQEQVKSASDSVAGSLQPEGDKSVTQKASDMVSGTGTGSGEQGQTVLEQAQEMAGNAAQAVKDAVGMGEKK